MPLMNLGRNAPAQIHEISPPQQMESVSANPMNVFVKPFLPTIPAMQAIPRPSNVQTQRHAAAHQNAQLQKFQIEQAIRLLQMEYNSIMARVANQNSVCSLSGLQRQNSMDHSQFSACNIPNDNFLEIVNAPKHLDGHLSIPPDSSQSKKRGRDDMSEEPLTDIPASSHGKLVLNAEVHAYVLPKHFVLVFDTHVLCRRLVKSTV